MTGQTMTLKEKLAIIVKTVEFDEAGKEDEAMALTKTVPMPPFLAKIMKEKVGADYLLNSGWNLSEAEAEFGQDWLSR
ncbi:MAG: hypothetical protein LBQ89_04070 [Treponema sp.]|jgi:hypothetical protein|nr:hypothetical protein [Treponema sp.]